MQTKTMRKLTTTGLAMALAASFGSCDMMESNDANNVRMYDTVMAALPSVNGMKIEVEEHQDITVVIYDKQLFNASEDQRKEAIDKITGMTVAIYEHNNQLKKGKIIFLEKETMVKDISKEEQKAYDMDFAPLLKQ